MNIKEARELIKSSHPSRYNYWYSRGFLEGLASRDALIKELVEALESIVSHQEFIAGDLKEYSTTRMIAKEALTKAKEALEKKS